MQANQFALFSNARISKGDNSLKASALRKYRREIVPIYYPLAVDLLWTA